MNILYIFLFFFTFTFASELNNWLEKNSELIQDKKFNISFAECGHQNLWQRSTLGIVAISSSHLILKKTLQSIENEIENTLNGDLIHTQVEYL